MDSFKVMDVMQEASILEAQGKSIIHMEVGQPSSGAAPQALSKLCQKILTDRVGYTVALGLPELKVEISKLYKLRYNLSINPERIIVTSGSSAAFTLAFTAFFDAGDKVLVGEPGYPSYRNILKSLNLEPQLVSTCSKTRFQITDVDILNSDAQGVLIASPSNPTGTSLNKDNFKSIVSAVQKKGMTFISDEIYHGINFCKGDNSALEFDQEAVVINSFSKYFFLTGWRVGWMIVPTNKIKTVERLAQNLYICPAHSSQLLALYSLDAKKVFDQEVVKYKINRDLLMELLPKLGFTDIVRPDGAFYIYANISRFKLSSDLLARRILNEAGVALTPGGDFDTKRGHMTIRFSYACSLEDVREAAKRLTGWCAKNIG